MGLQLKPSSCREAPSSKVVIMKFFALIALVPLALCDPEADPGYGRGRYGGYHHRRHYAPVCRTVYDTITEQECATVARDVPEQQCATTSEEQCTNIVKQVPEQVCETVTEEVCRDEAQCTIENRCEDVPRTITEQQCTTQEQCTETQQCTTETKTVPETSFTQECRDIVTEVCSELQTTVDLQQRVVDHTVVVPQIAGTVDPSLVAAAPGVAQFAPATAVGPLVGALGLNIPTRIAKREADADAQFLFGGLPAAPLAVAPAAAPLAAAPALAAAPLAVAAAPAVAVAAPVAVAAAPAVAVAAPTRSCQQKVERECRQVPVETLRTVAVPNCVAVPKCTQIPREQCSVVSRDVPDTVCVQVPKTECVTVTKQVPETVCTPKPVTTCAAVPFPVTVQVPVERCDPVAREVCHPVQRSVARKACGLVGKTYGHVAPVAPVAVHAAPVVAPAVAVGKADPVHHGYGPTNYAYGDGNSFVSVSRAN